MCDERRTRKKRIFLVALTAACVCLAGYQAFDALPGRKFFEQYKQLRLGATIAQVTTLFGRAPDYVCSYGGTQIVYFSRGSFFDTKPDPTKLPFLITAKQDIPYLYGSGQFLFSRQGRLAAYTCNGEEVYVRTVKGNFGGSHLRNLNDDFLRQLITAQ